MHRLGLAIAAVVGCGGPEAGPAAAPVSNAAPAHEPTPDERIAAFDQPPQPVAEPVIEPNSPLIGTPMPAMSPLCSDTSFRWVTYDLNQDGTIDSRRLYQALPGGREVMRCKQLDFDYDGKPDATTVFDANGDQVLELDDFDYDGRIDAALVPGPTPPSLTTLRDTDGDGLIDVVSH